MTVRTRPLSRATTPVAILVFFIALSPLMAAEVPPPRAVTLFPSGIGEFLHVVDTSGATQLELVVDRDHMPDVLRTLTVEDPAGSPVVAAFPSGEPVAERLRRLRFDLSGVTNAADLLNQARGARVTVELDGGQSVTGTLLAVDAERVSIVTEPGVREIPREDVSAVRFLDEALDAEFRRALAVLAGAAAGDGRRQITIQLASGGRRQVFIRYLRRNPAWRVSYRAVVDPESARMRLQGWAHLDNVGVLDWQDVRLTLVSSQPQTLSVDLYTPGYPGRPTPAPAARLRAFDGMSAAAEMAESAPTGSAFTAAELPDGFAFSVPSPVTLAAGDAAMVPLVDQEIRADRIRAFDARQDARGARAALRIRNDTNLQLPPGPMAVFEGGQFAGDVMLPLLVPDEPAALPFARDPDVDIRVSRSGDEIELRTITVVDGVLVAERRARRITDYAIDWRAEPAARRAGPPLVITHYLTPGWTLASPTAAVADNAVDFTVTGPRLVVTEEQIREQRTALTSVPTEDLVAFADNRLIDPTTRRIVRNVAELRRSLADRQRERQRLEAERAEIATDQARIRENMSALSRTSQLYERYEADLRRSEDRLGVVVADLSDAREAEERAEAALREYVRTLQP